MTAAERAILEAREAELETEFLELLASDGAALRRGSSR